MLRSGRSALGTVAPGSGPFAHRSCPQTLAAVLTALPRSNPAELTISALSLALLVPVKELNVRFRDKLPTPIPGEIVMVRMAPANPLRARGRPCLSRRNWPLPPSSGIKRGHSREVLLLHVPHILPCIMRTHIIIPMVCNHYTHVERASLFFPKKFGQKVRVIHGKIIF